MVNQKGRGTRAENAVAGELGLRGYDVVRSAASKGAADLVALHDGEILLIQVKLVAPGRSYTQPSPSERRELLRIARRSGALAIVAQRYPGAGSRTAVTRYYRLTDPGPDDRERWLLRDSRMEEAGEVTFS